MRRPGGAQRARALWLASVATATGRFKAAEARAVELAAEEALLTEQINLLKSQQIAYQERVSGLDKYDWPGS